MWGRGLEEGEGVFGLDGRVGSRVGVGKGFSNETAACDTERDPRWGGGDVLCVRAHRM